VRDRGLEGRRKTDIDRGMLRTHLFKLTDANLKRLLEGRAPRDDTGQPTVLHHRGQHANYKVDE
jgi:hypothetical protein